MRNANLKHRHSWVIPWHLWSSPWVGSFPATKSFRCFRYFPSHIDHDWTYQYHHFRKQWNDILETISINLQLSTNQPENPPNSPWRFPWTVRHTVIGSRQSCNPFNGFFLPSIAINPNEFTVFFTRANWKVFVGLLSVGKLTSYPSISLKAPNQADRNWW